MSVLRLYWRPVWMTDADYKRTAGDPDGSTALLMSNPRMEKILAEAHARGGKDAAHGHFREGVEAFGAEVRGLIARWPKLEHESGPALVPAWDIEKLLDEWNVPAPASPSLSGGETEA